MLKLLYNYYMVLRSCWIILLFQSIGYLALVGFEQGTDILATLSLTEDSSIRVHTIAALFAVLWWSWQSWRAARAELHFKQIAFKRFSSVIALQAQVLIPRLLGVVPLLIFFWGVVKATGWHNPLVYVLLSLAFWLFIFLVLRKDIVVFLKSKPYITRLFHLPDYIVIKNEAYPASFLWAKQSKWILFRLSMIILVFALILSLPLKFPQIIGSSALVLFALGAWQVVATVIDFAEKHYQFPFTFTLIVVFVGFSFFNNNHTIRSQGQSQYVRPSLDEHFDKWYHEQMEHRQDSVPVVLVASQGGGVRAAYWTAQVLGEMQSSFPGFDSSVYAYSSVSGATLGVSTYKLLKQDGQGNIGERADRMLSKDFLSPLTAWLIVPEIIQRFLPFPIDYFDRSKVLERSWEVVCDNDGTQPLSRGFLETTHRDRSLYIYQSTHAESGRPVLLSNVQMDSNVFRNSIDLFDEIGADMPYSTAISVGARFPFVTPPAVIRSKGGKKWGHLVDGGYVDNLGGGSLISLYQYLNERSIKKGYRAKFILVFIKNIKREHAEVISGMPELVAPLLTFSKVWVNSGDLNKESAKLKALAHKDEFHFVELNRDVNHLIPLGWYLSSGAVEVMRKQVGDQTEELKSSLSVSLVGQKP